MVVVVVVVAVARFVYSPRAFGFMFFCRVYGVLPSFIGCNGGLMVSLRGSFGICGILKAFIGLIGFFMGLLFGLDRVL